MENFNQTIKWLREGKKVRRPSWEKGSYWMLGIDESIQWKNERGVHIHLNQIEANDWEIFKEEKPKVIILDDNVFSLISYAEEFPENWKKICKALDKKKKKEDLK